MGNMKTFLAEYLEQSDPEPDAVRKAARQKQFAMAWGEAGGADQSDDGGESGGGERMRGRAGCRRFRRRWCRSTGRS